MEVVLYTTHCPKCKVLKLKLDEMGITYKQVEDVAEMIRLGFSSAPVLTVDGIILDFLSAVKWIKEREGK